VKVRYVDPAAVELAEGVLAYYQAKEAAEGYWDSYVYSAQKFLRLVQAGHQAAITKCVVAGCKQFPPVNCRKTGAGRFRCAVKLDGLIPDGGQLPIWEQIRTDAHVYGYKRFGLESWCGRIMGPQDPNGPVSPGGSISCPYWAIRTVGMRVTGPRSFTYAWRS